ncbi:hypothetical protein [Egbenema bharatensis]|uniref:hypothetical protein n=1 Tax=Egbenema bharatensis TaxID=3463334 RepID=UPI003A871242
MNLVPREGDRVLTAIALSISINAFLFSTMQKLARLLALNGLPPGLEAGKPLYEHWVLWESQ